MTAKRKIRLLYIANLALVACFVVFLCVAMGDDGGEKGSSSDPRNASRDRRSEESGRKTESYFAPIYGRNFRRPLNPVKKVTVARKKRPLPFQLTGTAVDGDETTAFLKTAKGEFLMVSDGQTVMDAKIIKITGDSITVEFDGQEIQVKVQSKEGR